VPETTVTSPFVAPAVTSLRLPLSTGQDSKRKPAGGVWPAVTRLVVRESSSELMVDRSLASRAGRMQLTGPACLGKTPARSDCPVALVLAISRDATLA
jgi:hypothetical protein